MRTDLFDYHLPPELIAQEPTGRRSDSRLMTMDRESGAISHHVFADLPLLLEPSDCLVVNTTRVFPGRLKGKKAGTGGKVELLLLERLEPGTWEVLCRGRGLRVGSRIELGEGSLAGKILSGPKLGKAVVRFEGGIDDKTDIDGRVYSRGGVPLPPYIKKELSDSERYQTVYSRKETSAAAPTAGLHFTRELLEEIEKKGVTLAGLELSVSLDTFVPVREEHLEDHSMHSERFSVKTDCVEAVNRCNGRVLAVGTTTVRALESSASSGAGDKIVARDGRTDLFITPGYEFRVVDALITNFHFPRSTLLMLVCAFGGVDLVMKAYREAVEKEYRFYSFGDAMLIT